MTTTSSAPLRLCAFAFLLLTGIAGAEAPPEWQTRAEASGYTATSTYAETVAFLERLASRCPALRVTDFGRSGQGRPLPLVIVSAERAFTPAAARAIGKPILLVQSCIHAGEVDGKDASLLLLRDLALGQRPDLLAAATLLVVPIYNVDGHERVSPYNRPNQDGPVAGMGFRTTASGLDLNRDFMKLDSPEARALIALFNAWRPDLHVDNHITDGSDHAWVLTWARAEAPQVSASLESWLGEAVPRVLAATAAAGFPNGPYVELVDRLDPTKGISSAVSEPRLSTGYFPLRNRPSILVETHSYKPFRQRVEANRAFLDALLVEVGRSGAALVAAAAAADRQTVALGRPDAAPSEVVLDWKAAPATDRIQLPLNDWWVEPFFVTGKPLLRFRRDVVKPIEVPWEHRVEPAATLARPRGYLLLPGWPQVERLLAGHGLRVERLERPARLEVETIRVSAPRFATESNQGHVHVTATVTRQRETHDLPAGSLWVPADQPDFAVAVQLVEPEAPDSMLQWGLLDSVFERKEYIGARALEEEATGLLTDPAVRAAWEQALADPAFAADSERRYEWWYRRTPHWDETVGLLPLFRVLQPAPLATRPWTPPSPE